MSRSRSLLLVVVALGAIAATVVVLVRSGRPNLPTDAPTVTFPDPGVMRVDRLAGRQVEVFDDAGRLLARPNVFGDDRLDLRFAWQPGAEYRLDTGDGTTVHASAPETMPALTINLHAPFGQEPYAYTFTEPVAGERHAEIVVPSAPGETVDLMLVIEKRLDAGRYRFSVESPFDWQPAERDGELRFEFDDRFWTARYPVGDVLPPAPIPIVVTIDGLRLEFALHFVARELAAADVQIVRWALPTSRRGAIEPRYVPDQLALPNQLWNRLAIWFHARPEMINYYEPFAYQTVWLHNGGSQPVSLLLESQVLDPRTGEPLAAFDSPQIEASGLTRRILGFCHLPPGETRPATLPVYVTPGTPAGNYLRRLTLTALGRDQPLLTATAPLGVVRTNPLFTGWVLGVIGITIVWLVIALVAYRRLVDALGLRILVLLALLGSLQFCLQFVGGMISNVFYTVLGPFNCLVGGLLTEVMTYLLVTSILFLVPRVGAMTLAGIVSYLMGAILFGAFSVMDLLFIGSAIAFREVFLYAFRVTHCRPTDALPRLLPTMLALGLADACSTFTNLVLQAVFYRLYFADWYILLQVVVTGFAYTLIGVYLGRSVGRSLRRVHP